MASTEAEKAYAKLWRANNPERFLEIQRKSRAKHYDAHCKRVRDAHTENRKRVNALKEQTPCLDCGGVFPTYVMDFHHVRGKKVKVIGRMLTGSWERVAKEIAKCDLLCANCHRVRTHEPSVTKND